MFPVEWQHTVSATRVTTTREDDGDSTPSSVTSTISGVLYAPEGITEAVGAPVIGQASLYGAFPLLDADDTISHQSSCGCGGQLYPFGTAQVVGGSKGWAPGKVVVPIQRTGVA